MNLLHHSPRLVATLCLAALGCSCQQHVLSGSGSVGHRTYADSVVHLGQVDPAYRPYFQAQHGANYSLADQRKAYLAAAQTARTPVREADYHPGDIRKRKALASGAKGKSRSKKAMVTKKAATAKKRTAALRRR